MPAMTTAPPAPTRKPRPFAVNVAKSIIGAFRGPTLAEQIGNLHNAYCHSQQQFVDAAAVLRAVRADLSAYHKADDDRISVAMARIDMWADGTPGADKWPYPGAQRSS